MKVKTTIIFLLSLVLSAAFLFASNPANEKLPVVKEQLKVKSSSGIHSRVTPIPMRPGLSMEDRIWARHSYLSSRPGMTKEEVIRNSLYRNAIAYGQEPPLYLESDGLRAVPGGGDIFNSWHVSFDYNHSNGDTTADFDSFELIDLLGNGNDWLWLDYVGMFGWPEQYRSYNSAFAPEPGGDFGGAVEAKVEALQIKVGVAKESTTGDPYRVASLLASYYFGEPDYDGDGNGYLDDYLVLEILEEPKWHMDTFGSQDGSEVWWCGDTRASWGAAGYSTGDLQYLNTNAIDLTSATAPTLTYKTAWSFENEWDGGTVLISDDAGATWEMLTPAGGYPSTYLWAWDWHNNGGSQSGLTFGVNNGGYAGAYTGNQGHVGDNWTAQTIDLSAYIGSSVVIRFALAGDGGYDPSQGHFDGGWWLDDISVADGGDNLVTDLTSTQEGPGYTDPWVMLDYYYDTAGGVSESHSYNITENIVGSVFDSLSFRWTAIFDDNDDGNIPGTDTDWGFEISDATLRVTTRFETDAGANFVDLVDADGDSILSTLGYALVGETYDPVATIQNYGLTDINIYNAFVEIENTFGDLVYQRFIYTYAPGQGDTLGMFPGYQDFNDGEAFYNFPDWTCLYEGDYILRAYFEVFGGDDEPLDDMIEISFHAHETEPNLVEFLNSPTTPASLFADGWTYETTYGDTSLEIADYFGRGDTEAWWTSFSGSVAADSVRERLISPPLDCSAGTDYGLKFTQSFFAGGHPSWILNAQVSADGTSWTTVKSTNGSMASADRHGTFLLDISSVADGEATVYVAFEFVFEDTLSEVSPYGYSVVDDIYVSADLDGDDISPAIVTNLTGVSGDMTTGVAWDPVTNIDVMYYTLYGNNEVSCEVGLTTVAITPDDYPGETSWVITDDGNAVVASGLAAGDIACLPAGDYTFTIYDSYGDGMTGSYSVTYNNVAVVDASSGFSGTVSAHVFTVDGTADADLIVTESAAIADMTQADNSFNHSALTNTMEYYYWLTATDHNLNESESSDTITVIPADVTAPATVMDLMVTNVSPTSVLVEWSAPAETVPGEGSWYDIRMAHSPINDDGVTGEGAVDWDDATEIAGVPAVVAAAGTAQSVLVEDLLPGIDTYFALKTTDEVDNESELSNVVSNDDIAPAPISDLDVMTYDDASITFSFTATGDDGNNGVAVAYDLRVAYGSDMNWELATPLNIDLIPGAAGSNQVVTVSENVYLSYALAFAVVALDNNGNASEVSNVVIWRPNGIVPSQITAVVDIPEDQGYQVRVSWTASDNEGDPGSLGVIFYGLWRMIEIPADAAANIVTGYIDLFNAAPTATVGDKFRVVNGTDVISEWDFIANVPAHADELYNFVAPTLVNETNSTFMVSAHSAEGFITNSAPVAGISVDNLAPSQVTGLVATITESETVLLSWEENDDAYLDRDLAHYAIYRSEGADFTLLATAEAIEFIDETVTSGATYDYYVIAVDFSGNESESSAIVTAVALAIDLTASIPESFKLSQNYPNPFNPNTAIEFALPENAFVKLTIFNILGQEVRSLASSYMEAAVYRVIWNGRDNNGRELTSGTYIYRIQAGKYSKTLKMAYIK